MDKKYWKLLAIHSTNYTELLKEIESGGWGFESTKAYRVAAAIAHRDNMLSHLDNELSHMCPPDTIDIHNAIHHAYVVARQRIMDNVKLYLNPSLEIGVFSDYYLNLGTESIPANFDIVNGVVINNKVSPLDSRKIIFNIEFTYRGDDFLIIKTIDSPIIEEPEFTWVSYSKKGTRVNFKTNIDLNYIEFKCDREFLIKGTYIEFLDKTKGSTVVEAHFYTVDLEPKSIIVTIK